MDNDEEPEIVHPLFEEAAGLENEEDSDDSDNDDVDVNEESIRSTAAVRSGTGFTGVVGPPPLTSGGATSSIMYPGWPAPVSPTYPTTYPTTTAAPALKKRENVKLPSKTTRKVLIAFIEEEEGAEDQIVWAAHLQMEDISININADPEDRDYMDLTLSLEDHYGNNKK